jgi:hypothetical protein
MKEIGIKAYFGGLGDSLQFSTLPRRFSELGYEVYLVNDAPFRSIETKELVWDNNPYILGQKNVEWRLGDTPGTVYENKFDSFIKNWEYIHGLTPINDFPEIYYEPLWVDNIEGIIDISSISITYNIPTLIDAIRNYILLNYPTLNFKLVSSKYNKIADNHGFEVIEVESLKNYVDIINSCKVFISVNSGSHSLAAGLRNINKEFKHVSFIPENDKNFKGIDTTHETLFDYIMRKKIFIYPTIDYIKI